MFQQTSKPLLQAQQIVQKSQQALQNAHIHPAQLQRAQQELQQLQVQLQRLQQSASTPELSPIQQAQQQLQQAQGGQTPID